MMKPSPAVLVLAVLLACASLFPGGAVAAVMPIVWSASGMFDRRFTVEPGGFAELCGPLIAGNRIAWTFTASGSLDFNVHYHVGRDVRFPAARDGVAELEGVLDATTAQDYCWMWTNKGPVSIPVEVRLRRLAVARTVAAATA